MKKILVYMREGGLLKTGGPSGYNFALKQQLDLMKVPNIEYIHKNASMLQKANSIGNSIKTKWYGQFFKSIKDILRWTYNLYYPFHHPEVELEKYDIIHFHSTQAMYEIRRALRKYKGKVVLTSHSPCVLSQEKFEMLTPWNQKHMKWLFKHLIRFDRYAFMRADYIIFPCPEAEEPYYHTWKEYSKIRQLKKDSFRYLLTGTYNCIAKHSKQEIFAKYGIPQDAYVICYVGRHNSLKGYDVLKEIGKKVLAEIPNAYFLIAGVEYPMSGLKHPRWIEAGWTNDPHSIIAASDIFVLPNKETYFDLIMLEVLSLGTIVVASSTGGNKYFEKNGFSGIFTFKTVDGACEKVVSLSHIGSVEKKKLQDENRKLFENNFSLEVFGKKYVELINSL